MNREGCEDDDGFVVMVNFIGDLLTCIKKRIKSLAAGSHHSGQ